MTFNAPPGAPLAKGTMRRWTIPALKGIGGGYDPLQRSLNMIFTKYMGEPPLAILFPQNLIHLKTPI
jgi:hypothetical protein